MPFRPSCQTADFFVLRSPGLPLDALSPRCRPAREAEVPEASGDPLERDREALREVLREHVRRGVVREAIALASPDLASRVDAWLEGSLMPREARNLDRALLRYLGRMSSRSTPFGLFAAVSRGAWGPASHLAVGPWPACRKALRLDWGVLEALVDRLEREPEVRAVLRYRPNSSLYVRGGWHRYQERRDAPAGGGRTYHLEAVEATPHLDFVLQQAEEGAPLAELVQRLTAHLDVAPGEAQAFLERLIDAQVLCGELQPPLTSPDPLGAVTAVLQAHPATATRAAPLVALARELDAFQGAPLGSQPGGCHRLAPLAELGLPLGTRDVLQVDLFRPAPDLTLSQVVRQALEEGAETLRRLTAPAPAGPLDRFRAAFSERYGTRWLPLLEVLDEESGLGFDGGEPLDSPLLEGLSFRRAAPPRPLSSRDQRLLAQLPSWQGAQVWDLSDADVDALSAAEPQPFPPSFAALACLAAADASALDRGEFQFWMEHYSGPTAARWLGRFASGEPELNEALQRHLRKEETARPDAVFAEVVHVPEGRMGNVLARPSLRDYEIPYLAAAGVPRERTILPGDLQVTVRDDRIRLASARLGREVVPRLSSAHNFARGPAVYRFLAHLQDQDGRPGGWSWGVLSEQPFLPRVTRGRQVLCKARWRLTDRELQEAMAGSPDGAWSAFQSLRAGLGLPRFVQLTDADHTLRVDLDQVLWVETLHRLVSGRPAFTLTECFPEPGQALVTAPEGRVAHELVIPFEAASFAPPKASPLPSAADARAVRSHPPGSEWLYLKLYCGPASADRLLVELEPLLRSTRAEGLWDRWHFIRYRDPDPHLRLRFHGAPARLLAELLPRLHAHFEARLAQGLLWTWQVDTFAPELERYGGPLGFALAEGWFFEDSQRVLEELAGGLTLEERWRTGLRNLDAIWAALGLDLWRRQELARASRDGFRKEFRDPGDGAVQMGTKFRSLRRELEAGFPRALETPVTTGLRGLVAIREAAGKGLLQEDLMGLAGSLAHMHLNRLLRADHREQEWVLMEFLARLYDACLAQSRRRTAGSGAGGQG